MTVDPCRAGPFAGGTAPAVGVAQHSRRACAGV